MKHISILVPEGAVALSTIEGSYIAFTKVNDFLVAMGKAPLFKVQLVGLTKQPQRYSEFFTVIPDLEVGDFPKTDLIIIPAINGDKKKVIEENSNFIPWMVHQYKEGAELASLCVGAFLLASTGLVKGKQCSTHWLAEHEFRSLFPDVNLVSEKIITDEQGIYSSGGAHSFWNLLLYLIEKYVNREMAILASKYFVIEIDKSSQSSFIIFRGQKEHDDEEIKKAQEYIEQHYTHRITVDELADEFAIGRRSLERRFKKATSNTVTEYVQRVKIEAAKKSFETNRKNINEVMFDVGYTDIKAFRDVFKKITGMTPIDYRNKFNREATV
jgi:transcriptional regulator GlxA family with amidase domain